MSSWSYQASSHELSDEQYSRWQSLLEERTGICFSQHKSILQQGLRRRMRELGLNDYQQYYHQVSAVPEGIVEWTQLVDRIAVKETNFFREINSFNLVNNYLRALLDKNNLSENYNLDVWSVGCATGEEAYSLAITAKEVIDCLSANVFLGVTATDISQTALTVARQGIYDSRKLEKLPPEIKNKYFSLQQESSFQVINDLRQRLCFAQGNIQTLADTPKLAMDVIYCQNVLIYFHRDRQQKILSELVKHLKAGGLLVVGSGEATGWKHPQMYRTSDRSVQAYIKYGFDGENDKIKRLNIYE